MLSDRGSIPLASTKKAYLPFQERYAFFYSLNCDIIVVNIIYIGFGGAEMNTISSKKILIAFLCITFFVIFLVAGFFVWYLFIPAILAIIGYVMIDRKFLRCPHCNGFTNLDRLFYARTHTYHCSHCGEVINIEE